MAASDPHRHTPADDATRRPAPGSWEAVVLAGLDRALRLAFGKPGSEAQEAERPAAERPAAPRPGAARRSPTGTPRPVGAARPAQPAPARGVLGWLQKPRVRRTWKIEAGIIAVVLVLSVAQLFSGPPRETLDDGTRPPGLAPPTDSTDTALPAPAPPSPVEGVAVSFDADGSLLLDTGVRAMMFGVALPGPSDPPVVTQMARRTIGEAVRGQRVALEFDPALTAADQRGQPVQVGYVWLIDEAGYRRGMLNALVLAYGFGRPVSAIAYRYQEQFADAAELAQQRRAGVWAGL